MRSSDDPTEHNCPNQWEDSSPPLQRPPPASHPYASRIECVQSFSHLPRHPHTEPEIVRRVQTPPRNHRPAGPRRIRFESCNSPPARQTQLIMPWPRLQWPRGSRFLSHLPFPIRSGCPDAHILLRPPGPRDRAADESPRVPWTEGRAPRPSRLANCPNPDCGSVILTDSPTSCPSERRSRIQSDPFQSAFGRLGHSRLAVLLNHD